MITCAAVMSSRASESPFAASNVSDSEEIKQAGAIVRVYWQLSSEKRYELFSRRHKELLRRLGARDASDYAKAQDSERVYRQQVYQRAVIRSSESAQVTVLATWEHVGYEGVMTFIFDLIKEDGAWKIAWIAY